MLQKVRIVPIGNQDRSGFECGVEALDVYLRTQATQDARRRVSNCFVAVDLDGRIAGYYTFAAASVLASDLPPEIGKKLPRYPRMPAALIGPLAVDRRFQRQRLGEALIGDAALRARDPVAAVHALVVDVKDEHAHAFYRRLGFLPLLGTPATLFLPIATAIKASMPAQQPTDR
jgi:GNAT superfamily N-acetyltransferase